VELVFVSAAQLAGAIRAGDVSATEALDAHLAQIDRHNPALNAVVTLDAERARERARAAFNPPNPAPTMTTRGLSVISCSLVLLLKPYIYKIHAMGESSRSSWPADSRKNTLLRWLVPSVADLIFIALLASLLASPLSMKLLGDAGIGWHIRTGQWILGTHTIPRVDPFSTHTRKPWIAWEWLYDVMVGRLEASAGLNGVVWLTAAVIAAVFAALFGLLMRRGTDLLVAIVLTLLAMASSMIHFLARPHVLSWLFALIWFWILDSAETAGHNSNRRLWLLPALMLVWVNVHGGFLLGLMLLAFFWAGSMWTWLDRKESRIEEAFEKIAAGKRVRDLTFVGLASVLATLVNPYGWRLHGHIYSYLTNRFFMDHIEEFQSPNFHGIGLKCFLVLLLIGVAVLAAHGRQLRGSEILVVLFAVSAGLYSSRNVPVSAILLAAVLGPLLPRWGRKAFPLRMAAVDSTLRGHFWPILATIATFMIAANGGRVGSAVVMDADFDPQRMPVEAVNFLERAGVKAPVFSPDYWGGYILYRLYPRNQVTIDDRHDFYGEAFMREYLRAMHVEPGWEDVLKGQSVLVLPTKAALTQVLSKTTGWKAVYSDDVATVFTASQVARIPTRFGATDLVADASKCGDHRSSPTRLHRIS